MKPFYYSQNTNFGDHMNSWLWAELAPDLLSATDNIRLIGIGSLLSRNLDLLDGRKVVFGSGSGYSSLPDAQQVRQWKVYCVRGPLTARFLELEKNKIITDGAWLINRIPRYANLSQNRRGTVFVPHWTSATYGNWSHVSARLGLEYVDPCWPCEVVFSAIANAELAIVESLHGAIVADYYGTPWIPVASPGRILKFKWIDWCQSLGLEYKPFLLPPSDYLDCRLQGLSPATVDFPDDPLIVPYDTFDVRRTAPPPKRVGFRYRAKTSIKTKLHGVRAATLSSVKGIRSGSLFRNWNERHLDKLSEYFSRIESSRPFQSSATVRNEKIDQLNLAFELMRSDYLRGRL